MGYTQWDFYCFGRKDVSAIGPLSWVWKRPCLNVGGAGRGEPRACLLEKVRGSTSYKTTPTPWARHTHWSRLLTSAGMATFRRTCARVVSRISGVFRWPKRLQFLRGYVVVAGGFIVHLTLGSLYTFGNLAPYITSYVRHRSHPTDLRSATGAWIYTLTLGGQGLSMILGGLLERKLGPRVSTLMGCLLMTLGVLLSYVAIKISFWLLLFTYGLMFGLGVGIAYIGPIASAVRWMPRWKGVTIGIVLSGFGLSALIFDPIQTVYINPHNKSSDNFNDDDLLDRVPTIFLIMGAIYLVLQVVGSLMIVDPPEFSSEESPQEGRNSTEGRVMWRAYKFFQRENDSMLDAQTVDGIGTSSSVSPEPGSSGSDSPSHESRDSLTPVDEESRLIPGDLNAMSEKNGRRSSGRSPVHRKMKTLSRTSELESSTVSSSSLRSNSSRNVVADLGPLQMLRKVNFYLLWVMMLLAGFSVFFTATLYKFFGQTFIRDDHFLAVVGAASAICNCTGRIVWGLIADYTSYKFSLVFQSGTMSVFLLTLYATSAAGKSMFFIWVCVIFFCIGGVFSLFPTAIARSFGSKYVSINYGLLFTSQIFSSVVGALLFSTLEHLLGWVGIIFLVSGVSLVGFAFTLLFRAKRYMILDLHGQ